MQEGKETSRLGEMLWTAFPGAAATGGGQSVFVPGVFRDSWSTAAQQQSCRGWKTSRLTDISAKAYIRPSCQRLPQDIALVPELSGQGTHVPLLAGWRFFHPTKIL